MDEQPEPVGGMVVSHDQTPTAEPNPMLFAPLPGWHLTGADEPVDEVGSVVWGVDPGGWTHTEEQS